MQDKKTQPNIENFFKSITKDQYLKNIKNEPIQSLIKDVKININKSKSDNKVIIEDENQKTSNKKLIISINLLYIKYEGNIAGKSSTT